MNKLKLRLHELKLVTKLFITWILTIPLKEKNFWLISERGKEARDNGYALYKWIKENHPERDIRYIINKSSKDFCKIDPNDIVEYNSLKHYMNIWTAKCLISTHIMGYTPDLVFFSMLDKKFKIFRNKKKIFLQHGIIKDKIEGLFFRNINVDLFVSGSKIEYDYLNSNYGYPSGIISYTGLCRYDNLIDFKCKNQILIMPTFRIYVDRNRFEESEYFRAYSELLSSNLFQDILEKYNYNVIFYPHYEFQSKIESFKALKLSNRITIADMSYDVQALLKDSSMLITDFSSVFFDMMYMNKPIIFYQFDEDKYRAGHYKVGYLNYHDVGPVVMDLKSLLEQIEKSLSYDTTKEYQQYYNRTFTLRDTNNCYRVYNAIEKILQTRV